MGAAEQHLGQEGPSPAQLSGHGQFRLPLKPGWTEDQHFIYVLFMFWTACCSRGSACGEQHEASDGMWLDVPVWGWGGDPWGNSIWGRGDDA